MTQRKVALILIDGLKAETASERLTYLERMVCRKKALYWTMRAMLPSLSRPLYETVHTGLTPSAHGILSNEACRPSNCEHVFEIAKAHGRRTGASAFSWMSELYNGAPFNPSLDGDVADDGRAIQYARFYAAEDHPDEDVFHQGCAIAERYAPDYLLIHSMGVDYAGHAYGGRSSEYVEQVAFANDLLKAGVPYLRSAGYHVLVTSDHGMDDHGHHGGPTDDETLVPFYSLGQPTGGYQEEIISQLAVAPTILDLMGLPTPLAAAHKPLSIYEAKTTRGASPNEVALDQRRLRVSLGV